MPCPSIRPDLNKTPGLCCPLPAALTGCVAPRLIVGREDPKVAASDKLLIVHRKQGACGGEEFWVKNHLAVKKKGLAQASYVDTSWEPRVGKTLVQSHTASG